MRMRCWRCRRIKRFGMGPVIRTLSRVCATFSSIPRVVSFFVNGDADASVLPRYPSRLHEVPQCAHSAREGAVVDGWSGQRQRDGFVDGRVREQWHGVRLLPFVRESEAQAVRESLPIQHFHSHIVGTR